MPRKKSEVENPVPLDMLEAMSQLDVNAEAIVEHVMAMESRLIEIAHNISQDAISIHSFDTEQDRVAAAHRQVELLGKLYLELRDVTNPDLH